MTRRDELNLAIASLMAARDTLRGLGLTQDAAWVTPVITHLKRRQADERGQVNA